MLARRKRMVATLAGSVAGVLCIAMSMPAGADNGLTDGLPVAGPAVPDIPLPVPVPDNPATALTGQVPVPAGVAPALPALPGGDPGAAVTGAALPLLATAAPLLSPCSSDALALAQTAVAGTGLPVGAVTNPALATAATAGSSVPVEVPDAPDVPVPGADGAATIVNEGVSALRLALNLAGIMVGDLASGAPCSASVADATSGTPNLAG